MVKGMEISNCLIHLVQPVLGHLVFLVCSQVVLPINHPNMSLLILGNNSLAFDLCLDSFKVSIAAALTLKMSPVTDSWNRHP